MVALPISPRKTAVVSLAQMGRHHGEPPDRRAARLAQRSVRSAAAGGDARMAAATAAVAHAVCYSLYCCRYPISGWLYSSATGVQVVYLGAPSASDLVPKRQRAGRHAQRAAHATLNSTLFCAGLSCIPRPRSSTTSSTATPCCPECCRESQAQRGTPDSMFVYLRRCVARSCSPSSQRERRRACWSDKSEIRFVSKQMGVNVRGPLSEVEGRHRIPPKQPLAASKAEFDIDLGSIDLASEELGIGGQGFGLVQSRRNSRPRVSSRRRSKNVGGDKYEVAGGLRSKGITKDAVVPIALKKDATGNSIAEGVHGEAHRLQIGEECGPTRKSSTTTSSRHMSLAPRRIRQLFGRSELMPVV